MGWFNSVLNYFFGAKPMAQTTVPSAPLEAEPTSAPPAPPAPRGVRNNNPGNIDRDNTEWEGMSPDQSSDPRFIVFTTPEYGIRALVKILQSYQREGFKTINEMIGRWAPSVENNTTAYQAFVAARVGVSGNVPIDLADPLLCESMVAAIIAQENANYTYPRAVVQQGVALAAS